MESGSGRSGVIEGGDRRGTADMGIYGAVGAEKAVGASAEPEGALSRQEEGRPRVVVISFCCGPGEGSEVATGWSWTKFAAAVADVTLVTTPAFRAELEAEIERNDLSINVLYLDLPMWAALARLRLATLGYCFWQLLAARAIRRYERDGLVDAVHQVSFSSSILPSALLASNAPSRVWGPIGGSTRTPVTLYRYLTVAGAAREVVRDALSLVARCTWQPMMARHATVIIALNQDEVKRFGKGPTPVVLEPTLGTLAPRRPASAAVDPEGAAAKAEASHGRLRTAVFAARLIPWKGVLLAVRAMQYAPSWRLVVLGDGQDRLAAEKLVARLGLGDRVELKGRVPRPEVFDWFDVADALLFPSFHDAGGWVALEARAAGCHVVCLDAGGPSLQAGPSAQVVPVRPAATLAYRLGQRIEGLGPRRQREDHVLGEGGPADLEAWYTGRLAPGGPRRVAGGVDVPVL